MSNVKFGDLNIRLDPGADGYAAAELAIRELAKLQLDLSDKDVIEIGPKHGLHTMLTDVHNPRSITCVELPSKKDAINKWIHHIKSPVIFNYCDLLRFQATKSFDLVFFCGVLYHNNEQLRLLKKLHSMANDDALMVFESSVSRNPSLQGLNAIEVCWPERFRSVETIIFHPSKMACKSLLEIAGWDVIASSDDHADLALDTRVALICRKSNRKLTTYAEGDVDHGHVEIG